MTWVSKCVQYGWTMPQMNMETITFIYLQSFNIKQFIDCTLCSPSCEWNYLILYLTVIKSYVLQPMTDIQWQLMTSMYSLKLHLIGTLCICFHKSWMTCVSFRSKNGLWTPGGMTYGTCHRWICTGAIICVLTTLSGVSSWTKTETS